MIWLKYGSNAMAFKPLNDVKSLAARKVTQFETSRGYLGENLHSSRRKYTVIISKNGIADETAYIFLENYHVSNAKELSFDGTHYFAVQGADGDIATTFIDDIRFLPEVSFVLSSKSPGITKQTGEEIIG